MAGLTLVDKRVLITGGSAGIGKVTALTFAAAGAKVVIAARGKAALDAVVAEMPKGKGWALVADITDTAACKKLVEDSVAALGGLDIVVNNGAPTNGSSSDELDEDAWATQYKLQVSSAVVIIKAAIPELIKSRGVVVNVSSVFGHMPVFRAAPYCAAKAAQDMLTKTMALKYAPEGVRFVGIAPGATQTTSFELFAAGGALAAQGKDLATATEEEKAAAIKAGLAGFGSFHPLGRVGLPQEVADAILFVASPQASFITGVILDVDGGTALTNWFTAKS